tara:strand:+ start:284 stop:559 length:276 start_codon:yes stop_codon:yes gene_type:complete
MNKHISLVKKWLNDPDSVSQKGLKANYVAAHTARARARARVARACAATEAIAVAQAAAAAIAASAAADAAADADAVVAAHWVKRYEELSNE